MREELLFTAIAQHLLPYSRAPEILIEQMNSRISEELKEVEKNSHSTCLSIEQI